MEYVLLAAVVAAFGYFLFRRTVKPAVRGGGGGARNEPGNTNKH